MRHCISVEMSVSGAVKVFWRQQAFAAAGRGALFSGRMKPEWSIIGGVVVAAAWNHNQSGITQAQKCSLVLPGSTKFTLRSHR